MDTNFLLPRLYERDIDVLLQEELLFNANVSQTFARGLKIGADLVVRSCALSVVDATGETDVHAVCSVGNRRVLILIENKIDAAFQPHQPERYKARANKFAGDGKCEEAFCVLMAPTLYVGGGGPSLEYFDAVVSYEELVEAVASEGTPRAIHRAALLKHALERAGTAYVLVPDAEVTHLWQRIYKIASTEFGSLRMKKPGEKGRQSKWIVFKADLPPQVTIDWKISDGIVDLSFWKGGKIKPVPEIPLSELGRDALVEQLGEGTVVLRLPLGEAPNEWRHVADNQIRDALQAACDLHGFYKQHPTYFR